MLKSLVRVMYFTFFYVTGFSFRNRMLSFTFVLVKVFSNGLNNKLIHSL